jgi:L-aspartate oxidase
MAWRAGAVIRDLEFVQFHPTALMLPGAPHFLISEAVRGEGARLMDSAGNSPVADLPGRDLAPRDAVSRALVRRMRELQVEHLWLDLRPVGQERLEQQFPTILGRCRELGLEPTAEPIPVAPAAHYWMGGIRTDLHAATTLPGLYAVGEAASTGVHGANRLASNSLMECLVFARQLRHIQLGELWAEAPPAGSEEAVDATDGETLSATIEALRQRCWTVAGVERQATALRQSLGQVQRQRAGLERQPGLLAVPSGTQIPAEQLQARLRGHDLLQRLSLAELLLEAALFRQESRGGHYRVDCQATQPFWQRHTLQQKDRAIHTEPIGGSDQKLRGPL